MLPFRWGKSARGSAWLVLSTGASMAVSLAQVALVTRLLGKQSFGQLVLITTVTLVVRQFVGVRVWEWAMKQFAVAYVRRDADLGVRVARTSLALSLGVNLLSLALQSVGAPFAAARFLHDPSLTLLVIGHGLTLLVTWTYDTSFAILRLSGRFRFLGFHGFASAAVRLLMIGGAVALWRRLDMAVAAYIVCELLLSIWLFAVAARAFRRDLGTTFWRRAGGPPPWTRGEVTRFLLTGALTDTLKVISGRMDLLVLGFYHAPAAAAVYQAAWNLVDAANRLANPVSMVIFSDVAKLAAAGEGRKLMSLAKRLSAAALVCVVPACLVLTFASEWIVRVIYGNAYAEAAPLLAVLSWTLVWLCSIWLQPMLVSIGRQIWGLYFLFVVTPLKVGLLFLLVPGGGAMGLAWANLIYHLSAPLLLIPFWLKIRRVVLAPEFASARG